MPYDTARKHAKANSGYKLALREARTNAIRLANLTMERTLRLAEGDPLTPVPEDALKAMTEVLKEAREVLGAQATKRNPSRGIKGVSAEEKAEALKALEEG